MAPPRPTTALRAAGGRSATRSSPGRFPGISSSSSIEAIPPRSSRNSMMSAAVTGPMPSIVSRSAWSAEPRLIGPSSAPAAADAGLRPARRDDHLLAVGEPCGEVDRVRLGAPGRSAGPLDRVGDPRAGGQPVDAGLGDGSGDVDDDVAVRRADRGPGPTGSVASGATAARRRAGSAALANRPDPSSRTATPIAAKTASWNRLIPTGDHPAAAARGWRRPCEASSTGCDDCRARRRTAAQRGPVTGQYWSESSS